MSDYVKRLWYIKYYSLVTPEVLSTLAILSAITVKRSRTKSEAEISDIKVIDSLI